MGLSSLGDQDEDLSAVPAKLLVGGLRSASGASGVLAANSNTGSSTCDGTVVSGQVLMV